MVSTLKTQKPIEVLPTTTQISYQGTFTKKEHFLLITLR